MAVRITPEGDMAQVFPSGKVFTLLEMYRLIDCDMVEIVRLVDDRRWLVLDEEGLLREKPVNHTATFLYNRGRHSFSWIVGTVLLAEPHEVE